MSAGSDSTAHGLAVVSSLDGLAPQFRERLIGGLEECNAKGFDAVAYETYRSPELQAHYYALGRTIIPPSSIVTNVEDSLHGWHAFYLAADVISASMRWDVSPDWRDNVTEILKAHGLDWGGDWPTFKDLPHYQMAGMKHSPSDEARRLYAEGGLPAVWSAVGAA